MNSKYWILLAGAGIVGGVVLLNSRKASASPLLGPSAVPTTIQPSQADGEAKVLAALRSFAGARAVASNGSAGTQSLVNGVLSSANAKNAQAIGVVSNKVIPGSGAIAEAIGLRVGQSATGALKKGGDVVVSGLKKLKFW